MDSTRITFIGCGNMGHSLIGGLIADGYDSSLLCGADIDRKKCDALSEKFNIKSTVNNEQAIHTADVIVLAVKPQAIRETLATINEGLLNKQRLLISVAAGIRLKDLLSWTHTNQSIVRTMPNTPALVQTGATALCANQFTSDEQRNIAEAIMRAVGLTVWLNDEELLDVVTALSGSGPAYFFLVMEAMEKAATGLGLPVEQARLLTLQTAFGAAKMALESKYDPAILRQHVTSPGGTTEKAINVLLEGDFEKIFREAMKSAMQRSRELADQFGE